MRRAFDSTSSRLVAICTLLLLLVDAPRSAVAQAPPKSPKSGISSKELDEALAAISRPSATEGAISAALARLGVAASELSGHEDYAGGRSYAVTGPVKKTRRRSVADRTATGAWLARWRN